MLLLSGKNKATLFQFSQGALGQTRGLLGVHSLDRRLKENYLVTIKNQHTWRKEPSSNSEAWWWRCEGLGLLFCFCTSTSPFYPRNHELSSLSSESCHQPGRWSRDECGLCIKTMTRNIPAKLQWDCYSRLAQSESGPWSRSNVLAMLFCPSNLSTGFWEEVLPGRVGKTPCWVEVMAANPHIRSHKLLIWGFMLKFHCLWRKPPLLN